MSPTTTAQYGPNIPLGLYSIMTGNTTNKMAAIANYVPNITNKEQWIAHINRNTNATGMGNIHNYFHPRHALPTWVSPTIAFLAGTMFILAVIYVIYNIHHFVKKMKENKELKDTKPKTHQQGRHLWRTEMKTPRFPYGFLSILAHICMPWSGGRCLDIWVHVVEIDNTRKQRDRSRRPMTTTTSPRKKNECRRQRASASYAFPVECKNVKYKLVIDWISNCSLDF